MKKTALILAFLLTTSLLMAGLEDKVTMDFKDVDIRDAARIVCKSGNFGIAVEKSVRGNITISVKDVSVKQALDIITRASGFGWTKTGNTIFIADQKKLESQSQIKVIRLKNIQAGEMAKILSVTIKEDLKIAAELSGNSIILNGTESALNKSMTIIGLLDRSLEPITGSLKITQKEKTIHEFRFVCLPGENVNIKESLKFDPVMVGEHKKHNFSEIEGKIRLERISNDGYCSGELDANIAFSDRKSENEGFRNFKIDFAVEPGKKKEVFSSSARENLKVYLTINP